MFMIVSLVSQDSWAQSTYLEEVSGKPIRVGQYVDMEGSPYLQDNWAKGEVKMANGDVFTDVDLKYDLVGDILLFKNKKEEPLEFVQPVKEFSIIYSNKGEVENITYRNGYPAHEGLSEQNFYKVIADGKTSLLKKETKVVRNETSYNSATITKKLFSNEVYYIYKDGKFTRVKKDQKSLLVALKGQEGKLKEFIKSNKLSLKEDKDLAKLISYYNSLS